MTLTEKFLQHFLTIVFQRTCPDRIPISGPRAALNDCYAINLRIEGEKIIVKEIINENYLLGKLYNDKTDYCDIKIHIALSEIKDANIEITHYIRNHHFTHKSLLSLYLHHVTKLNIIRVNANNFTKIISTKLFNSRKLQSKKRLELLQYLVDKYSEKPQHQISLIELMWDLYGIKVSTHPDFRKEKAKLELYLKSFLESGELKRSNKYDNHYALAGKAIVTLEHYEEDERRHTDNVKLQRKIATATIFLVLFAVIQSGVIKVPALIDFTKYFSQEK